MNIIILIIVGLFHATLTQASQTFLRNNQQQQDRSKPTPSSDGQSVNWNSGSTNEKQSPPDPNVALEGQCVVVCDADVIASKTLTSRQQNNDDSSQSQSTGKDSKDNYPFLLSNTAGLVLGSRRQTKAAFSVMRSSNLGVSDSSMGERRTVTFDYVMVNIGNVFDMESSAFVAPVAGTYSVSFQIYKLYNKRALQVSLVVNSVPTLMGFADANTGQHEVARNSGLINLRAQDRVKLEIVNGDLDGGWKFSTFSGYLVYEEDY